MCSLAASLILAQDKKCYEEILRCLREAAGGAYNVHSAVLDTKENGIPHSRKRVYIIGIKKCIDKGTFKFPQPIACPELKERGNARPNPGSAMVCLPLSLYPSLLSSPK
jgi:site-specific DNA-cytosine methylase